MPHEPSSEGQGDGWRLDAARMGRIGVPPLGKHRKHPLHAAVSRTRMKLLDLGIPMDIAVVHGFGYAIVSLLERG